MIRIYNKKYLQPLTKKTVRIAVHRPYALGNPFRIGLDGDLSQVLAKFNHWLLCQLAYKGSPQRRAFDNIRRLAEVSNVELVCHCAPEEGMTAHDPLKCHAQIIAGLLETAVISGVDSIKAKV